MQYNLLFFRFLICFVFSLVFIGCTQKQNKTNTPQEHPTDTIVQEAAAIVDSVSIKKRAALVKQSFLSPLYALNVAQLNADTLTVSIPFDLHTADAQTPDCYITRVEFQWVIDTTALQFPKTLPFLQSETGCIDQETQTKDVFELKEVTPEIVIYHAKTLDKTLVLLHSNEKTGSYAYYFDTMPYALTSKNWLSLLDVPDETEHISYPYRSSVLTIISTEEIL